MERNRLDFVDYSGIYQCQDCKRKIPVVYLRKEKDKCGGDLWACKECFYKNEREE